jgi:protoporphyrinogen/coproporphyrinogen III oxidase
VSEVPGPAEHRIRPTVAVVGAGIAGLAAARRIRTLRPDASVVVFEAAPQVGGKLRRQQVAGFWIDVGAEAMLARRPEGITLADQVGLGPELIHPITGAASVRSRKVNHPLPAHTLLGVPTDVAAVSSSGILSVEAITQLAAERDGPPVPALSEDIAIGDLVERRLGAEVVDRLVDPLLGGVYAGHARSISLRAAAPALAERLADGSRSLIAAAAEVISPATTDSPNNGSAGPVFASVASGLARLPEALAADQTIEIRTGCTVRAIVRTANGYRLTVGPVPQESVVDVAAVVVATPAPKAAQLLSDVAPAAATELASIELASMVIVTLAFDVRRGPIGLPAGSGILVPAVEGLAIKATTFSSQKWPGLGAPGTMLLRASLGRAREQWAIQRADSELVGLVRAELEQISGVSAVPIDTHVQRWGGGLPQYEVGHADRIRRVRAAVSAVAGLAVCGAAYDGVGIPACIASAHIAADQILDDLGRSAE